MHSFFYELLPTYGLDIAYNQYHRQKIKARNKLENILKQGFSRFDFFLIMLFIILEDEGQS